ncbi:ras-related protein Rab-24-like [Styela clava]|uniref:ras-related protein Rab-24-like n=1 Tax=Styela clava TaxID=7725 RepID=UPI00193A7B30|nr:ras-related protein Rab-24-like [Styela clava]
MTQRMPSDIVDCKVVLLGKECGGKTSLVERFLYDRFNGTAYQNTIGAAFGAKKMQVNGRWVTLGIWDTAGSEKYQAMSRIYYRGARAAIVCYDVADVKSFEKARFWVNELQDAEEHCKIYLCGTKLDLVLDEGKQRAVDYHDCVDYGTEIGATVFETSSKTNHNVLALFQRIADEYVPDHDMPTNDMNSSDIDLNSANISENKKNCCFT